MPGMSMGMNGSPAAALAGLPLFSAATSLHLLRMLSAEQIPDADRIEDAGHAAMAAGMTIMLFPGLDGGLRHTSALVFLLLSAVYLARAGSPPGPSGRRIRSAAIGVGLASMAYVLEPPADAPAWLPAAVAGVLVLCALVHGRRMIRARHGTRQCDAEPADSRLLVTLPHLATLATSAAMAWMAAAV
jgi:hypothetical protein